MVGACGSSGGSARATKVLEGPGFSFSAPATWSVRRAPGSVAVRRQGATVSAAVYRIGKAYDPSQFALAARELDAVAARAAAVAGGRITQSRTTSVASRKARVYDLATPNRKLHIGFLLDGRREFQLLCEAPLAAAFPDAACALLFSSFALR
ncbi:MAG: hypothetical protein JO073_06505 [Actinobacteria bacterium]|nr:hypothetical protein [Actinomycetota bacterium]